jgi:MYXO-CTERM domain-containing protein
MEVDDVIDVYGFSFAGGAFSASMCVDCLMGIVFPLPYVQEDMMVHEIIMPPPGLFTIALFNDDFSVMFDSATGSILELISIEAELAAGNYFLEITTGADDPPFTVTTSLIGAFQVAEPHSLAILGLSLLALGLARRRRKTIV